MTWRALGNALFLLVSAVAPVDAQAPIIGVASVIDGYAIEIHGQRIRLFGIDAPEISQFSVRANGEHWRCGQQASFALADWIGSDTQRSVANRATSIVIAVSSPSALRETRT
jgi:endonuclease YncB( thermonuclease family)